MSMLMVWAAGLAVEARAEGARCEAPQEVRAELGANGIAGLVVRGVAAPVRLVPGTGKIAAVATTCDADAVKVKLRRTGTSAVATVSADRDAELTLVIEVPTGVGAVTMDHLAGPLEATAWPRGSP
ncbi:MAG: hypothetical protein R3F59_08140 [Myxococcota bacterium]